jgi:hypothetical protein
MYSSKSTSHDTYSGAYRARYDGAIPASDCAHSSSVEVTLFGIHLDSHLTTRFVGQVQRELLLKTLAAATVDNGQITRLQWTLS